MITKLTVRFNDGKRLTLTDPTHPELGDAVTWDAETPEEEAQIAAFEVNSEVFVGLVFEEDLSCSRLIITNDKQVLANLEQ